MNHKRNTINVNIFAKRILWVLLLLSCLSNHLVFAEESEMSKELTAILTSNYVLSGKQSQKFIETLKAFGESNSSSQETKSELLNIQKLMREKFQKDYQALVDLHDYLRNMTLDPIAHRSGSIRRGDINRYRTQLDHLNKHFLDVDKYSKNADLEELGQLFVDAKQKEGTADLWDQMLIKIQPTYQKWNAKNNAFQKELQEKTSRIHMENSILSFTQLRFIKNFQKLQVLIRSKTDPKVYNF